MNTIPDAQLARLSAIVMQLIDEVARGVPELAGEPDWLLTIKKAEDSFQFELRSGQEVRWLSEAGSN